MPTYFERFLGPPTYADCPSCGGRFRLVHFRKWWGTKRILREVCISCEPDKRLSDMTPDERVRAAEAGRPRANVLLVKQMNEREHAYLNQVKRSGQALRRRQSERLAAWKRALLSELTKERAWAKKNSIDPMSEEWGDFFDAYVRALDAALARARAKANQRGAAIEPTPVESDPATWVYAETRDKLRSLYSRCPVVRGRRLYRDPAFLTW
jgi:hypothetical protein